MCLNSSSEDVTWLFAPKMCFGFFFPPLHLNIYLQKPVRTRLPVNLCTHLTSGSPQKMQNIPFEASVLWLLSMWEEEIDRRDKFWSIYLTDLCLLVCPSVSVCVWPLHWGEEWPQRIQPLLTTFNYFHSYVLQTDLESSKSEVWQAEVKVSLLEWGTQSQGFVM